MKKTIYLTMIAMMFYGLALNAQTKQDSLAIEKACRNYVEGWAVGNIERVAQGVSPELVKRTISRDKDGVNSISNMGASLLINASKMNKDGNKARDFEPDKNFKLDVFIYDITGDYALAKTVNTKYGFFDYCQLAKFNGEWKIINVLWGMLPQK
ncbi:MAG: hypothetical protein CVU00_02740 [Bacteroidetes bacterium HGW-Bacteroidetes-17]|nr:MAG: hypothetical protein CVU00_02740 [Bacteroidetes bacterium HGW-Bacteroidetes-17]